MKDLFGSKVAPYAKAWMAFLGLVFVTLANLWTGAPEWVAVVGGVLTVAAVFAVPNTPKPPAVD